MPNQPPIITYLFGAGASAKALPTVKEISESINEIISIIENELFVDNDIVFNEDPKVYLYEVKQIIIEGLIKLMKVLREHTTLDTYARKLAINNKNLDSLELIAYLSLYFNIIQKVKGSDPRYDTFMISLFPWLLKAPSNIKFLSWNYDLQMEHTYRNLFNIDFTQSFRFLNTEDDYLNKNTFSSVKLNGSCTLGNNMHIRSLVYNLDERNIDIEDFIIAFCYFYDLEIRGAANPVPNIKFSWSQPKARLNKIVETYSETEILVIIGYSFPFFNRDVDRQILQGMSVLKKIYIQDKVPKNVFSNFRSILPAFDVNNIETVEETDQFFLPPEL